MFGSGTNTKHPACTSLRCLMGVGLAMLSVGAASAQPHPDLSGYWELRNDSFNVPQASVTLGMLANVAAQIRHDIEAVRWCDPIGMPAIMGDRAPIDLRQSASVIGIVAKPQSSARYIYLDGRKHPEKDELEPTTNGHAIGRWEGEVLVADTIGFSDRGVTLARRRPTDFQLPPDRALPADEQRATPRRDVYVGRRERVHQASHVRVSLLPHIGNQ
jgi:hypothetical protein